MSDLFGDLFEAICDYLPVLVVAFLVVIVFGGAFLAVHLESAQDHEFRMACIEQGMTWIEERCEP